MIGIGTGQETALNKFFFKIAKQNIEDACKTITPIIPNVSESTNYSIKKEDEYFKGNHWSVPI